METMETTIPKNIKNPFTPVTAEQIYADLARSRQQIEEGRGIPMEKALEEIGRKHGFI